MGGPGGAEKLERLRLAAMVSAPPAAAGSVWTHAAGVEGSDRQATRAEDEEKARPRGCVDSGK